MDNQDYAITLEIVKCGKIQPTAFPKLRSDSPDLWSVTFAQFADLREIPQTIDAPDGHRYDLVRVVPYGFYALYRQAS